MNYLASCALSLSLLTVLGRSPSPSHSRPGRLLDVTSEGHALEDSPTRKRAPEEIPTVVVFGNQSPDKRPGSFFGRWTKEVHDYAHNMPSPEVPTDLRLTSSGCEGSNLDSTGSAIDS